MADVAQPGHGESWVEAGPLLDLAAPPALSRGRSQHRKPAKALLTPLCTVFAPMNLDINGFYQLFRTYLWTGQGVGGWAV